MIANNGSSDAPEITLDGLLETMKQIEDMQLASIPAEIVKAWGRETALKLARSAEGRSIGPTRVFLPPGHEHSGEMFLLSGDKLLHIGASFWNDGPIPVVMGAR